jgi:hypothetical protein
MSVAQRGMTWRSTRKARLIGGWNVGGWNVGGRLFQGLVGRTKGGGREVRAGATAS